MKAEYDNLNLLFDGMDNEKPSFGGLLELAFLTFPVVVLPPFKSKSKYMNGFPVYFFSQYALNSKEPTTGDEIPPSPSDTQ